MSPAGWGKQGTAADTAPAEEDREATGYVPFLAGAPPPDAWACHPPLSADGPSPNLAHPDQMTPIVPSAPRVSRPKSPTLRISS